MIAAQPNGHHTARWHVPLPFIHNIRRSGERRTAPSLPSQPPFAAICRSNIATQDLEGMGVLQRRCADERAGVKRTKADQVRQVYALLRDVGQGVSTRLPQLVMLSQMLFAPALFLLWAPFSGRKAPLRLRLRDQRGSISGAITPRLTISSFSASVLPVAALGFVAAAEV